MTAITEQENSHGTNLGVICNNKNSDYHHVPTHSQHSLFLMQNQRFREMKSSAKVIQIMSKLLRASWDVAIILCREPPAWVHSLLVGCLCLPFNVRSFLFSLRSAPEISLLSCSCVRMGAVLRRG